MSRIVRLAATALAAQLLCGPPCRAQEGVLATQAGVAALADEIAAWESRDMRRDPAASHSALLALLARVEADGGVSLAKQADLYTLIGVATFYAQDYAAAAEWMARSAAIFERNGGPLEKIAEAHNNRSAILRALGRLDEAEQSARSALAIRRQLYGETHRDIATALYNLANILYSQGRYEDAVPLIREAAAQQEATAPEDSEGIVQRLSGLAAMLSDSGRDVEGLAVVRRAEQIGRERLGETHQTYAVALQNLGVNLSDLGLHQQAIPILRETARLRREIHGEDHPWTGSTLSRLAFSLEQTGAKDEAEALNLAALAIMLRHREVVDGGNIARVQMALARLAAAKPDWPAYDERMAAARSEVDTRLPEPSPERAFVHVYHASVLEQRGDYSPALAIASQWVPVLQQGLIASHRNRLFGEMLLARLHQAEGAPLVGVWSQADATAGRLSAKLADITASDRERASEAESNRQTALLYFQMALAAGDRERMFQALQLANISDLALAQERLAAERVAEADSPAAMRGGLLASARRQAQLEQRYSAALEAQDEARIALLTEELGAARAARQGLEASLRTAYPEFVSRYRPAPVTLDALRASLAEDETLVLPVEGARAGWIVTIDRAHGLAWHAVDLPALRRHVAAVRAAVDGAQPGRDAFPFADAAALGRMIFPGGAPPRGRILLHGGRALASLPFSLLLEEDYEGPASQAPWLLRRLSFQVVGNLALHQAAAASPRRDDVVVAGIGGAQLPMDGARTAGLASLFRSGAPAGGSIAGLPPLPHAEEELRQIADALPGDSDILLLGPNAHEERLKAMDLSGINVIAFATHGLVAGELQNLWEPALLVGTGGPESGEDGLLGASEIAQLRLDADWVILSACNTSAGEFTGGPLYSGLASAFSQAGARTLMLSHWRVRDDAAARLSVATVTGAAAGLGRAEALRQAQLALIEDPDVPDAGNPAIWAPFIIVEN